MADPMINIYALLVADTDVMQYVDGRIYPTVAPQKITQPYIVWQLISNVAYNSLSCEPDADSQRMQVDCYSMKPVEARNLAFVVRDCLQTTGTVIDGPVPLALEKETQLFRWSMDALYFHKREVA